jgi:hypothetical protein
MWNGGRLRHKAFKGSRPWNKYRERVSVEEMAKRSSESDGTGVYGSQLRSDTCSRDLMRGVKQWGRLANGATSLVAS